MAQLYEVDHGFHSGEDEMHKLLRVPDQDNPTSLYLTYSANMILTHCPLLAIGTLDKEDRPWTTIWGGQPGFSRAVGQSVIGVNTTVDRKYDPVLEVLLGHDADGEVIQPDSPGNMVSAVGIDLESRIRVKLYGRMIAGALNATEGDAGQAQLIVKIVQSLPNCPKYLNKKHIMPIVPAPKLISDSIPLPSAAVDLLARADMFFISSSNHESDMDTNHRGGPAGFVRLLSNEEYDCTLVYPEYSGNRLYQTLGNLRTTPRAGLVFPDYETGNVLYITGSTEILVREESNKLLPRSNMVIKIKIDAARFIEKGLGFRGVPGEPSPYNPPVRYLAKENVHEIPTSSSQTHATLIERTMLTPTIARFRFSVTNPRGAASHWKPGQYVALSFQDELDMGYSHMRDDDPQSLNDDFMRTFTVSSTMLPLPNASLSASAYSQFDITIRNVGHVTGYLFRHNTRSQLEVPIQAFGGEFCFDQKPGEHIGVVAGGVGITPMLAQAPGLDLKHTHLYWSLRTEDLGLAIDSFERLPGLVCCTKLFVTGVVGGVDEGSVAQVEENLEKLKGMNASIEMRRLERGDLSSHAGSSRDNGGVSGGVEIERWYVCTGEVLKKAVTEWLSGRVVISESFNY